MNSYFGPKWDAPVTDDAVQVDTPLGTMCLYCAEPIEAGDQGLMIGAVKVGDDGKPAAAIEPVHRECLLRATVGSVAHLEGRCTCHTSERPRPGEPEMSMRDQGRATLAWLEGEGINDRRGGARVRAVGAHGPGHH